MLTIYSTPWCGYCRRLTSQLERESIEHVVIDIEADSTAADFVTSVNGGNRTVPTVRYDDGTVQTNPSLSQVKRTLAALPVDAASL